MGKTMLHQCLLYGLAICAWYFPIEGGIMLQPFYGLARFGVCCSVMNMLAVLWKYYKICFGIILGSYIQTNTKK